MIRQSTAFSLLAILLWAQPQTSLIPPSKDNTLFQSAFGSLSNGAGPHVFVGQTNQGSDRHAVLAFDIAASIPGGSTIQSVTLTMEMDLTIAGATTVTLHPLTQDWGEGTSLAGGGMGPGTGGGNGAAATTGDATWLHAFSPSSFWNTPGGDFIAAPSATTTVDQNGLYTWSGTTMVGDVQGWLDNPGSNFGWLLDSPGLATPESKRFRSREHPEAATRPLLNVTFLPPSGASVTSSGFGCPVASGGPGYTLSISAPPVIGGTFNATVSGRPRRVLPGGRRGQRPGGGAGAVLPGLDRPDVRHRPDRSGGLAHRTLAPGRCRRRLPAGVAAQSPFPRGQPYPRTSHVRGRNRGRHQQRHRHPYRLSRRHLAVAAQSE